MPLFTPIYTEPWPSSGRRLFQRTAFAEFANICFKLFFAAQARLDETAAKESNIRLSPEWPPRHKVFNFCRLEDQEVVVDLQCGLSFFFLTCSYVGDTEGCQYFQVFWSEFQRTLQRRLSLIVARKKITTGEVTRRDEVDMSVSIVDKDAPAPSWNLVPLPDFVVMGIRRGNRGTRGETDVKSVNLVQERTDVPQTVNLKGFVAHLANLFPPESK